MKGNQDRNLIVLFIFVMTLINTAASAAFEGKRAWPEVRGTLATKRSAPDIFGMLEDNNMDNKSTFEDIKSKVLKRLQREIRDAHSNYMESKTDYSLEGDGKSDSVGPYPVSNPVQFPAKTVEFQTNSWPSDYPQQKSYQRQLGDLVDWIRSNCKIGQDVSVDKRKRFDLDWDVTRGKRALGWDVSRDKRGKSSPDNTLDVMLTSSRYGCFLQVVEI